MFSGPLDLLLHLLREEQIEIADIPIARIADPFLHAIHELGLNQAADYLEMASRLVRLKVQLLLPRSLDDEGWEDPRAELVRRLLEYQQIREIARWMGTAGSSGAPSGSPGLSAGAADLPPPPLALDLLGSLQAVERVIAEIPMPVLHRVVARPLDVEGAPCASSACSRTGPRSAGSTPSAPAPTIVDVLSDLLALLELASGVRFNSCNPRLRAHGDRP